MEKNPGAQLPEYQGVDAIDMPANSDWSIGERRANLLRRSRMRVSLGAISELPMTHRKDAWSAYAVEFELRRRCDVTYTTKRIDNQKKSHAGLWWYSDQPVPENRVSLEQSWENLKCKFIPELVRFTDYRKIEAVLCVLLENDIVIKGKSC